MMDNKNPDETAAIKPADAEGAPDTKIAAMSFEEAMSALEELVGKLERGDVGLEESIELYEIGAELKAHCEKKLREAEDKISALALDKDGTPKARIPFAEE